MLRRLIVALTMAAVLALSASTAFAEGKSATAPNCEKGLATALLAGAENRSEVATLRLAVNLVRCAAPR